MSDFDGKPLVLRDDIEREFWGRVYSSEWAAQTAIGRTTRGDRAVTIDEMADGAVVSMRVRQGDIMHADAPDGLHVRRCAVCLSWSTAPHARGCPRTPKE